MMLCLTILKPLSKSAPTSDTMTVIYMITWYVTKVYSYGFISGPSKLLFPFPLLNQISTEKISVLIVLL